MNELFTIDGHKKSDIDHSGIKGMQWYIRRFQNPDGSLTPEGKKRYAKMKAKENKKIEKQESKMAKAVSTFNKKMKVNSTKLQKLELKKISKEEKRQAKEQKAQEALQAKKQKIFNSMDPKKMYENRGLFTNEEISAFNTRLRSEQSLKTPTKTPIENAENFVNNLTRATNVGIKTFDAYTKAADVINKVAGKDALPTFNPEKKKKEKEKRRKIELNNMSLADFLTNINSMTTEEIKDRRMREEAKARLRTF